MYLDGQGHEHWGPGTSMVQFLSPGFGSECAQGAPCPGLGDAPALLLPDTGNLFQSGWDFTQWGLGEWGLMGIGAFVLISVFQTMGRAGRKVAHTAAAPVRGVRKVGGKFRGFRKRLGKRIAGKP